MIRGALLVLCTAMATLGLAALSRAPYTPPASDGALLRLSWRMAIPAREDCRPRTAEELEALPVHMRTPEVCTQDVASYLLVVAVDSAAPDTVALARGGVKGDRPLFVLQERPVPPGRHRVRVGLHRAGEAGPPVLHLDTTVTLAPGRIRLITTAEGVGGLGVVEGGG